MDKTWYGTPFLDIFINRIEKILDSVVLFGAQTTLLYRLITNEKLNYFDTVPFLQEADDYSVIGEQSAVRVTGDGSHAVSKLITSDVETYRVGGGYLITNNRFRFLNGHRRDDVGNSWFSYHYLGALSYESGSLDNTVGETYLHSLRISSNDDIPKDDREFQGSDYAPNRISEYIENSVYERVENVVADDDFENDEEA